MLITIFNVLSFTSLCNSHSSCSDHGGKKSMFLFDQTNLITKGSIQPLYVDILLDLNNSNSYKNLTNIYITLSITRPSVVFHSGQAKITKSVLRISSQKFLKPRNLYKNKT